MLKRILLMVCISTLNIPGIAFGDEIEKWTNLFDGLLTIGGQARFRIEGRQNFDFDKTDDTSVKLDDRFGLSRFRLNFDLRPFQQVRLFTELQDSRDYKVRYDRRWGPGAFRDRIDFSQLFVEIKDLDLLPLKVRLGRQNITMGDQRLVGPFGWSNVGRSFQGVRMIYSPGLIDIDIWWVNVVVPDDNELNNPDRDDDFFGVNATLENESHGQISTYLLLRDHDKTEKKIYTIGGTYKGEKTLLDGAIDYNAELAFQTGDFDSARTHRAFAYHAGAGYTFKTLEESPRLGVQYNFATGDANPDDTESKTFDNLYPTNHLHYGSIDFFSWRNMRNVKFESSIKPADKLLVKGDFHFFWLDQVEDAWYNAGGARIREGEPGRDVSSLVGREIDITVKYTYNQHFNVMAGYSLFFTQCFVKSTGLSDNPDWFFVQTTFSL